MKKLFFAILVIFLSVPLCGYTIKGRVEYTLETAREEAFKDVEYTLPKSIIEANKVDPNYQENMRAKAKGENRLKNRRLVFFDDDSYGVVYKKNRGYGFYYSSKGLLEAVDKNEITDYPQKTYKYNLEGHLTSICLHVSNVETFVFEMNGKLYRHWIENKSYDADGRLKKTRKY